MRSAPPKMRSHGYNSATLYSRFQSCGSARAFTCVVLAKAGCKKSCMYIDDAHMYCTWRIHDLQPAVVDDAR